jgi:phosphoribosylanthranilate isomerase
VSVKVKICGVRTPQVVEAAADAGADFVGFIFFAKSPRNIGIEEARELGLAAKGRIGTVAVSVDADDALIEQIAEIVRPDILQLHGQETPERVAEVKALTGLPVMKAIAVASAADAANAANYVASADYILFDAKAPPDAPMPGGHGIAFDWRALKSYNGAFALSGGLNAANVEAAIRLTHAFLVDVSSGVERKQGEKDVALVRAFVTAAKQTSEKKARAS